MRLSSLFEINQRFFRSALNFPLWDTTLRNRRNSCWVLSLFLFTTFTKNNTSFFIVWDHYSFRCLAWSEKLIQGVGKNARKSLGRSSSISRSWLSPNKPAPIKLSHLDQWFISLNHPNPRQMISFQPLELTNYILCGVPTIFLGKKSSKRKIDKPSLSLEFTSKTIAISIITQISMRNQV